jgi:[glutamine synthetase] adenylyltransferase / [glutamine synthetase]-adenylyl-L-tyrosine phosphorylase
MTDHDLVQQLKTWATSMDSARYLELCERWQAWHGGLNKAYALALATAFPAFVGIVEQDRQAFDELERDGLTSARDRSFYLQRLLKEIDDLGNVDRVRKVLRKTTLREKVRIAAREWLPMTLGGVDVMVTAREVTELAEATMEVALREAEHAVGARCGVPMRGDGQRSQMVIVGMGKLGGHELNVGSDVDLLFLYDSDEGQDGQGGTLHEYWSRVARRVVLTLEEVTEHGSVWRVDLRLRPEGSRGALVNSMAAAVRYYESWGRMWERAALVRARAVAGDMELGERLFAELSPFVYRRKVDPAIASEMTRLLLRNRHELSRDPDNDLKLGEGGIREAEFFVQSLQLIWGGQEPSVRVQGTLDAVERLQSRGLVTDREARTISDSYRWLRRLEHYVQWSTGLQTHMLPTQSEDLERMARCCSYPNLEVFQKDMPRVRKRVAQCFASLAPEVRSENNPYLAMVASVEEHNNEALVIQLEKLGVHQAVQEIAEHLIFLARRPDDPLSSKTAESRPELGAALLEAIVEAPDPELAARAFRSTFSRILAPAVYVRALSEQNLRGLGSAFGASAFVGSAVANHPELRDRVLLYHQPPTVVSAKAEIYEEFQRFIEQGDNDPEMGVGAIRAGKQRVTLDVAMADLAGQLDAKQTMRILTVVAEATVQQTVLLETMVQGTRSDGLAVIALGKLGGYEMGYGSDLDVIFIYDPEACPDNRDPAPYFARKAQRIVRWVSTPHARGPGYELDVRLRPSGSQGMLVTSLASFARYHGISLSEQPHSLGQIAAAWERQALVRARFVAGDPELGARAIAIAEQAAYAGTAPDPTELHRLRLRLQTEIAREKNGRYDLKLGRGGIADVEFAVQFLQMCHGKDKRVRTTHTAEAILALEHCGYLNNRLAESMLEGYRFLRQLEQRIRIVHGRPDHLLEVNTVGLYPLARRMGFYDGPSSTANEDLLQRYQDVTSKNRQDYLAVLGMTESDT